MQQRGMVVWWLVAGVFAVLTACDDMRVKSSPVDQLIKERAIIDGMFLNHEGVITVVDTKSGQPVPPCAELEKTGKPCKHHFGMDETPKGVEIIRDMQIRIIDYIGSDCRTYVSRITGKEWEICHPPY